ncbi:hypothetical protein C9374_013021 [Naegleria lovaniensis]|uniref:Uncharacterized protein n=1 Tax=Naegleria lovaniensis TaxID=51637 RepID=A0AA88GE20_NAELO|nr:uncharacterized protein C9374_013021 [Naegleria lovaniensis]KAG2372899.1 hypothetical protein C9374_013021 [Naegleria lovaniensis]
MVPITSSLSSLSVSSSERTNNQVNDDHLIHSPTTCRGFTQDFTVRNNHASHRMKGKCPNHRLVVHQEQTQQNEHVVVYPPTSNLSTNIGGSPLKGCYPPMEYSPTTVKCQDQQREYQNSNNMQIMATSSNPVKRFSSVTPSSNNLNNYASSNSISSSTTHNASNFATFQHSPQIIRWNYKKTSSPPSIISSSCMSPSNKISKKQHSKFVNYGSSSGQLYFINQPNNTTRSKSVTTPPASSPLLPPSQNVKKSPQPLHTRRGKIKEYVFVKQFEKEDLNQEQQEKAASPMSSSSNSVSSLGNSQQEKDLDFPRCTSMNNHSPMNTTNTDSIHVVIANDSSLVPSISTSVENNGTQHKPSMVRTSISWAEILN